MIENMLAAYMACALWSSTDGDPPEPLDKSGAPFAPETIAAMRDDCARFVDACEERGIIWREHWNGDQMGHDLWLTRNAHGTGFWDRYDYHDAEGERIGLALSELASAMGERDLYIGDDGRIYIS